MKIAVGYVRCSTDMQDGSIEQQKKAIEVWAKANAYKVIEWFADEGKSGTSFEQRPAFMRLKSRVEASPNFEYVLAYDESRWGRAGNPRESTYWKIHFEKHRVNVRIVNSQSKNENDIGSYVIEVVEGAEASEYSKKLSRSTLRGCNANAQNGFSNGGTAPYGYSRVAINKDTGEISRMLLPGEHRRDQEEKVVWGLGNDDEVKTVKRIFELKCLGYGYRAIADKLNTDSVPCARRGRWRNKNQMWSVGTIQAIITNPAYCGDRIYNRHPLSKKRLNESNVLGKTKERWISDEKEWVIQRDVHPAIVGREIFQKASTKRKLAKKSNQHFYESPYLLTGLVKCEHCGFNYQGQSYRKHNIFYYVDGGNMNKGKSVCGRLAIRKEKLEGFVLDLIRDSLPFSKVAIKLEELISIYVDRRSSGKAEMEDLNRNYEDTQQKIHNLVSVVEKGIDMDTLLPRLKELEKRKNTIEKEREKLETALSEKVRVKDAAQQAAGFLLNFDKHFDGAPMQEKKEMIRQIVLGVRIDPEKRIATCVITKIPLVTRALRTLINPAEFTKSTHRVGAHCSGDRT